MRIRVYEVEYTGKEYLAKDKEGGDEKIANIPMHQVVACLTEPGNQPVVLKGPFNLHPGDILEINRMPGNSKPKPVQEDKEATATSETPASPIEGKKEKDG